MRSNRPLRVKYEDLPGPKVGRVGRALAYFRKVPRGTDAGLVRALVLEREFICDILRKRNEGAATTPWALPHIAEDAVRAASSYCGIYDASYGYIMTYLFAHKKDSCWK